MKSDEIKQTVKETYGNVANNSSGCGSGCGCGCGSSSEDVSKSVGYTDEEMNNVPEGSNLGLGCGNPTGMGNIKQGDIVLDLGSGPGFDAFLAAKKTGESGKVIGVDMTPKMINKAKENAKKGNFENVEFRQGDIQNLPVDDNSVDVIISNCVINLAPDKSRVFSEAKRVLKDDGKMFISDIVLLKELTEEQKNDKELVAGCIAEALLKEEYLDIIEKAGLKYKIISEARSIDNRHAPGIKFESLNLEIYK